MNRRRFVTATFSLTAAPLLAKDAEKKSPDVTKLDPALAAQKGTVKNLAWHNVEDFGVEGRAWTDLPRQRYYDRFPAEAEGKVPPNVWNLSRDCAGMMGRFKSNASAVHVRYTLLKSTTAMPHMPATGVSGIDLYARDEKGKWRWVNVTKPVDKQVNQTGALSEGMTSEPREYAFYLPLYNGVDKVEFGVNEGATFGGLAPRPKPIIFYGTSITHGACASRPGMCHPAILGRRFDRPTINLGFSGNGRMDASVGDLLCKVDAAVYVIDCLPNMDANLVTERCIPLVKQLRTARPDTPMVLVEDRRNTNSWLHADRAKHHDANHAALREAYAKLQEEGVKKLHYIEGDHLLGDDGDGATDGSHPSDLGFVRQADVMEPVIRAALGI
ncbi:MAG TPA: SGNH/GDSL hydrolase family protein [Verrucomicrobiaceae bacterium]